MLTRLKLTNFKSWQNLDIELAPITLLFGTNSSGKSSILQSLLLLKQTAEGFDRKQHINLGGGKQDYVDLGGYKELSYQHLEKQTISIGLDWIFSLENLTDLLDEPKRLREFWEKLYSEDKSRIAYEVVWRYIDDNIVIDSLNYNLPLIENSLISINVKREDRGKYQYFLPIIGSELSGFEAPESCYFIPWIVDPKLSEEENKSHKDLFLHLRSIASQIDYNSKFENIIRKLVYLGPLRQPPRRDYFWRNSKPHVIKPDGENTIEALIAAQRNKSGLLSDVSRWLTKMGIVDEFTTAALDKDERSYTTKVKIGETTSSLLDVGFGVSQVLPVITLLFFAPEGSIILLEQPELHLHPRAQSILADLFLEVAEKRHLQLIVESHSEHLLTRMQRRIAEVESPFATSENVKAYFCESTLNGSQIRDVEIDKYGQIRNWPDKFFGDLSGDLDALTDAALARRREELISGD